MVLLTCFRKRLAGAALVILVAGLAGCASGPSPSPRADFVAYQATSHPRAFAVTGGTLDPAGSYASGWSEEAPDVDDAIRQALEGCEQYRDASGQPACQLYAIGDTVVVGADAATVARAKCLTEQGALAQPGQCGPAQDDQAAPGA